MVEIMVRIDEHFKGVTCFMDPLEKLGSITDRSAHTAQDRNEA